MSSNPLFRYGNMTLTVEKVTPKIAESWMTAANTNNRRIRPATVAQYARDMAAGRWEKKPLAICFLSDGSMGNGQHTCGAIVKSGCTQELLIARNCTIEQVAALDQGLGRSMTDIAHFVGSDLTSRESSIARIVSFGITDGARRSFHELFNAYLQHKDLIDWVCGLSPKKKGFTAATLAVLVRAAHGHDRTRLMQFIDALNSGVIESQSDSAAIRLRDYLRSRTTTAGGAAGRVDVYRRTQSALHAFLLNKPLTKLYGTDAELFPIPSK